MVPCVRNVKSNLCFIVYLKTFLIAVIVVLHFIGCLKTHLLVAIIHRICF